MQEREKLNPGVYILTGGMGVGKTTLADRLRGNFDTTIGGDIGKVEGGKYVSPPPDQKVQLRADRAKLILDTARDKSVLFEGDPTLILKYPGVLPQANSVVDLLLSDKDRLARVQSRSKIRGSDVTQDTEQFKKEIESYPASRAHMQEVLGSNYYGTEDHSPDNILRLFKTRVQVKQASAVQKLAKVSYAAGRNQALIDSGLVSPFSKGIHSLKAAPPNNGAEQLASLLSAQHKLPKVKPKPDNVTKAKKNNRGINL